MKSLEKRIGKLEAQLPTPEDEEACKREEFLHNCTDEELRLLRRITEARENGEEPPALTPQEEEMWAVLMERWNAVMVPL